MFVVNRDMEDYVTLHSLTEQLDATTPYGFFSLQIAAAQFELEQIF